MIDFRYHLVSIISVFLALAVGIVLGAGPLQGNLGDQLSDQVAALRTEKQTLNDKLTVSEKLVDGSDEYASAVQPRVVRGRLTGHRAVVVVMPSADGTMVSNLEDVVTQSGAALAGTVTISPDWFDASQSSDRAKAAHDAATALGLSTSATGDSLLLQVLTDLTVSTSGTGSVAAALRRPQGARRRQPARQHGGRARAVGPRRRRVRRLRRHRAGRDGAVRRHPSPGHRARRVLPCHGRRRRRHPRCRGAVRTSNAVQAVREKSETAQIISTVDHARAGNGPATVVLALEGALDQRIGHYGIAAGATARVPRVLP